MTENTVNPLEDTESEAALAYAAERRDNIREFVQTSPDYYISQFDRIGASSRFTPTLNLMAGILGPVWFGARGLWSWALPFLILETLGLRSDRPRPFRRSRRRCHGAHRLDRRHA